MIVTLALGQTLVQAAPVSYYLSANGGDANPGTIAQPWRSLARLQTAPDGGVLNAGDQVNEPSTKSSFSTWEPMDRRPYSTLKWVHSTAWLVSINSCWKR